MALWNVNALMQLYLLSIFMLMNDDMKKNKNGTRERECFIFQWSKSEIMTSKRHSYLPPLFADVVDATVSLQEIDILWKIMKANVQSK